MPSRISFSGSFAMHFSVKGLSLLVHTSDGETISYEIRKLVTRIGRAATNDLVVIMPSVSRKHAALIIDRGTRDRLFIEDLRSQNGTRVNGQIINDVALVQVGDVIMLGDDVTLTLQEHRLQVPVVEEQEPVYNFPDSE
jgi:pSer/pThr/pTyr-binding forkhead associated (FHA) protein